ncbi:MAG TPA: hypothetical protein VGV15_12355 [Terriglobales bacterium]|nr:hypothetical protein [Terriglobales bacterium]
MVLIPAIALAVVAIAFLLVLAYLVWWHSGHAGENAMLLPVDLEAFRNLTDADEDRFLRSNLSPKEFRRIQRQRLRAAAAYISVISENASTLVVIGRSAGGHPDAETAARGLDVVHRGVKLKFWCSLAFLKLNITMIFPTLLSPSTRIADRYLDVSSLTASLPQEAGRTTAPTS